jgi:M6 family metalloprotease-like protein
MLTRILLTGIFLFVAVFLPTKVRATEPPANASDTPNNAFADRFRNFTTKRGFLNLTKAVVANRVAVSNGGLSLELANELGGTLIKGRRSIPVIMMKYKDTAQDPYPVANLQKELFGSWPSGTMTDFYKQISYNQFSVDGKVLPWFKASRASSFYEGPVQDVNQNGVPVKVPCNGLCPGAQLGALLTEALDSAGKTIDFAQYDDDGPDGIPSSADDDGYVDFVAFVHPGRGGECGAPKGQINNNIWSHRFRLSLLDGKKDYETKALAKDGRRIRVDDYVIMPALDCDGKSMIEIGVFSHEFGHAFGLPDLYNTKKDAKSQGVGNWDLMGAGSWGGDNQTPQRPAHMSAWSKAFLGWVTPTNISKDTHATLRPVEQFPDVLRVNVSNDIHYLLEYRTKTGFDDSLTGPGVLIWRINDPVTQVGLLNNSVNNDPNNEGVSLVQADGLRQLEDITLKNRGDADDPFPGGTKNPTFDNKSKPVSDGKIAICNLAITPTEASFDIRLGSGDCSVP